MLATLMVMPQMGYDMHEGKVVRWLKKEGEEVIRGEVIAEIETDKATVDYEAYTGGVMAKIVAEVGATIPVGQLIAVITAPGEAIPEDILTDAAVAASADSPAPATVEAPAPAADAAADDGEVRASPLARRLANERGIDLSTLNGTGPGGRIT
ncbi:MAG: E3 binding domain-containing protein, partial [Chloroflexi bacterium]|nr:E3 binding domain-containing protein [Chloroflexota bacterium]